MAVVLGNFELNKSIKETCVKTKRTMQIQEIENLINKLENQVYLAEDIYDTYFYVKKQDANFAKKLWSVLCNIEKRNTDVYINVNSYFAFGIGYNRKVHLSRFGVSYINTNIKEDIFDQYGLCENEMASGEVMLKDYIRDFHIKDDEIEHILTELNKFLNHFDKYAQKFFDCVSNYQVN